MPKRLRALWRSAPHTEITGWLLLIAYEALQPPHDRAGWLLVAATAALARASVLRSRP